MVGSRLGTWHVTAPMLTNEDSGGHTNTSRKVSSGGESGQHRRSPGLTPELQSAVEADEVVMTTPQIEMFFELLLRGSLARALPRTDVPRPRRRLPMGRGLKAAS